MSNPSLEDWLSQLESLHPVEIELGLQRVSDVAQRLGLLPVSQPVITVAGTNGKGSTVSVLESLGQSLGLRVGAYTSPHFLHFNERIRVDGREATDAQICAAFAQVETARGDISLTYFEFATLAALLVFRSAAPDVLVLEVGLGGRLDAVNIVEPSVAVITSIALDHQDWLGDTLDEIAGEKAGIARRSRPVVISDVQPPPGLLSSVRERGASPVLSLGEDFSVTCSNSSWSFSLVTGGAQPSAFGPFACTGLLAENVAGALQAALALGWELTDALIMQALAKAKPTGRRQLYSVGEREYLLDVAHNAAAVASLRDFLLENPVAGRTIAVFSVMSDKDARGMFAAADGAFDAWFLADQPANPRAANAAQLAGILRETGETMISVSKNLKQAMRRAQGISTGNDRIVVFGSFYTVAEMLPLLEKDSKKRGVG